MFLVELRGYGEKLNCRCFRYHRGRARWPIEAPKRHPMLEEDAAFTDL